MKEGGGDNTRAWLGRRLRERGETDCNLQNERGERKQGVDQGGQGEEEEDKGEE